MSIGGIDTDNAVIHNLIGHPISEDAHVPHVSSSEWSQPHTDFHVPIVRLHEPRIAVLVPCHNEAITIGTVVKDFLRALPTAVVFVYDNASTDDTGGIARSAGAIVRNVPMRGKGNVVRRMFSEIDADIYVLVDGDDTYDPTAAPQLVSHLIDNRLDMVVGARIESPENQDTYRPGHRLGNQVLTRSIHWLFGDGSQDMLSGYRVFSRRYVKSFPALSRGFETETEMTVHALELSLPFAELATNYKPRPVDSTSKLSTVKDGFKILRFITFLWKDYRPLRFFGCIATLAIIASIAAGLSSGGHLHSWTPATFAVVGFAALASIAFLAGVVLDSAGRRQRELKRMICLVTSARDQSAAMQRIPY